MMMGYGVPQSYVGGFPGPMYRMVSAGHMTSMSSRLPLPPKAATSDPNVNMTHDRVTATKVSSLSGGQTAAVPGDAAARPFMSSGTAAPGLPTAGASKSKQGLEKILDTLSKMFPEVRRFVKVDND